jgi:glutamyl-Q tRNA(Asp) synthetase
VLHLGSLATAAASFLEARTRNGRWLLRIEDLDAPRVVPGASDAILRTLEALGFQWDDTVWYQSQRLAQYEAALDQLRRRGFLYACSCTRRDRGASDDQGGYPGTCRAGATKPGPTALRFRADLQSIQPLIDGLQGPIGRDLSAAGDPVVRRRDGLHAYQLAVVVDDAAAHVSHVVRGTDLLPSCRWQRALQTALDLPPVAYAHVPLLTEASGAKLSKSAHAIAVPHRADAGVLYRVLTLLRQTPPPELSRAPVAQSWAWAQAHWQPGRLQGVAQLAVSAHLD